MKRIERLPQFVPFGAPRFSRSEERAVLATLRSGWVGAGPRVLRFEHFLAQYLGIPAVVAMSSCTAALHASLVISGVGAGDEVVTSPLTFVATADAILMSGATIRFVDVDPSTYNVDPRLISKTLTAKTAAVIPVHFGGLPADLEAIQRAVGRKTLIVEDAAHAIGARYNGRMVGASGNLVCFSFYANKNITTVEGGAVALPTKSLVEKLRILRMHGLNADAWKRFSRKTMKRSLAVMPGFKYNFTDLYAAIGLAQLRHVEEWLAKRERYANIYDRYFRRVPGVRLQYRPRDVRRNRHALHLYTLQLDQRSFGNVRDRVVRQLLRRNIGASIHYEPVHLHPFFRSLGFRRGLFPVAERIGAEIFTLPLTPHLTPQTIVAIAKTTAKVIEACRGR